MTETTLAEKKMINERAFVDRSFECNYRNRVPFSSIATDKIKKRYGALGQVLCHTIDRGCNTNIGISLAGHRDRTKMACFIAGINPKGVASATQLEIGDEILEVSLIGILLFIIAVIFFLFLNDNEFI